MSKDVRLDNHKLALTLLTKTLGDAALDSHVFDATDVTFEEILRTTWESLERDGYLNSIGSGYELTAKGWLSGLELSGVSSDPQYEQRLGSVLAAMKRHVKGRKDSKVVPLAQLATEAGQPEGFIFNIVDSRSTSTGKDRTGADWYPGKRGRMVEIPVDFNLEPVDIAAALSVQHLEKIEALEVRLQEVEEDRAKFHCPTCDAPIAESGSVDFPEHHCIVHFISFECGYVTADDTEDRPCPYSKSWPTLDEFDFETRQEDRWWVCQPMPKTKRARKVSVRRSIGDTKEEAEENARLAVCPLKLGEKRHMPFFI